MRILSAQAHCVAKNNYRPQKKQGKAHSVDGEKQQRAPKGSRRLIKLGRQIAPDHFLIPS